MLSSSFVIIDAVVQFIILELIMHARQDMPREQKKKIFILDLLQLPLSLIFTRVMNLFARFIPDLSGSLALRIPLLILAIICVGVGASMTLDMRLIANPADGIVQVISDVSGLKLGLTKNIVDISCVILTATGVPDPDTPYHRDPCRHTAGYVWHRKSNRGL